MISGTTTLIAHVGYPTHTFKSPLIYNPWFEKNGINAVVVPMGVKAEEYPEFFRYLFKLTNIRGALITMPHAVPAGRHGQRLPGPGRYRHALRADPGLPRVLRIRYRDARCAARRLADQELKGAGAADVGVNNAVTARHGLAYQPLVTEESLAE